MTVVCVPAPATVTPTVIDPRVQRGAELLDERMPGWADKVDVDEFDLRDGDRCVLGQIGLCVWSETYPHTAQRLLPDGYAFGKDAHSHGFMGNVEIAGDWGALEQDWRLAILSRRQA